MKVSNDYMMVLDEMRISKKIPVEDLCQDIISERTYYRMLKSDEVRTDVFSKLTQRLGVDLSELIHYAVFVRKNDSRFKFLYRIHTKYYRDIEEHYHELLDYQDPSNELNALLNLYKKKYLYETKQLTKTDYHEFLAEYISLIESNTSFNIYLFAIQLEIIKEIPNHQFSLSEVTLKLFREEFSYSVIMVAICYDVLLRLLLVSRTENDAMKELMSKFETFIAYFPSRYFLMRYNLYKAYIGKIDHQEDIENNYLFKFLMNALSILEEEDYREQEELVNDVFSINCTDFIYQQTEAILNDNSD